MGRAMRLLVVEDNATLSELLAKGLRTAGYEVDLLATAAEARTVLMTTTYAAVILDLGLPDGDGLAVLRELRHRKDSTPVLVLTARGGLQGRVVSKKQVEDHIFGLSGDVASNAVEVYVHRLRKQLSDRGAKVTIHTIRGVGYLIAEEKRDPV
jgi:DNA-binding response OmpR family regulator